jgi:hypothetical protein
LTWFFSVVLLSPRQAVSEKSIVSARRSANNFFIWNILLKVIKDTILYYTPVFGKCKGVCGGCGEFSWIFNNFAYGRTLLRACAVPALMLLLGVSQEVAKKETRTFPPGPPLHPSGLSWPSGLLPSQASSILGA